MKTDPTCFTTTQGGVTLFEMLITVAILAILVGVVSPAIQTITIKNRVTSDINSLSAIAQHARFTAINEQLDVVLCPSTDFLACVADWANAKIIFIDANGNGARDTNETLIAASDKLNKYNEIAGISGPVVFDEQGGISTRASIIICPNSGESIYASALLLSLYGRVSVAIDSDDDGIKEDINGSALSCR